MNEIRKNEKLTPEERARVLSRLHSLLYWVGVLIPEEELIDDQRIPLRDVVYDFTSKEEPTDDEVRGALALAHLLEEKAKVLEEKLQTEELTRLKARKLYEEIAGLLRAVADLRHSKSQDFEIKAKALMSKVDDERRWLEFIEKIKR
ncbi:MAG: hypothetical protein H5T41_04980 [Methanomassiliicoccales archaeon]|jgi:hypothetical protein|nr:hypothetical protein [Methanomassiliicoccales archaeon]